MSAVYTYDALGRRTQKQVTGGSFAGTTNYLDSGDDEIAEYDAGNTLLRRYIPGPSVDRPIAIADYTSGPEALSFFYTDRQGSVTMLADSTGAKTEGPHTYNAYGQCLIGASTPCTTGTAFKYTGRRLDPETGLYYYRARYYTPTLGRFLQTDPIGYKDDLNWYAYVTNDPMNKQEASGKPRFSYEIFMFRRPLPHGILTGFLTISPSQMQRRFPLPAKATAMADVLKFDTARPAARRHSRSVEAASEDEFSFWPEISRGLWVKPNPQPADPANGQGRVLFEMMLILGVAAAMAAAVSLFVGAAPPV